MAVTAEGVAAAVIGVADDAEAYREVDEHFCALAAAFGRDETKVMAFCAAMFIIGCQENAINPTETVSLVVTAISALGAAALHADLAAAEEAGDEDEAG